MKEKIHCCYHEAGHAVVAAAHDLTIRVVKVYWQNVNVGGYRSQTWTGGTDLPDQISTPHLAALIAFAGPAAEARYAGVDDIDKFCSSKDRQDVAEAGGDISVSRADAITCVESHWPWIELVAKHLEQHESMIGREVYDLRRHL